MSATPMMDQVNNDIKDAMRAKDAMRLEALRMLKAEFIKNNTAAKPTDELSITVSHAKRLTDSLEMYKVGTEAHDKLLKEIDYIKVYLPKAMAEAEVLALINDLKAKGAKDMGSLMKELQPQIKGKFDGKRASELVKAAFA
jgi:uncharacterized protein YqeY